MTGESLGLLRLRDLVRTLRGPDGCPWDHRQTLETVRAYLVEEAHEVVGAIDDRDLDGAAEELGDLLFQVVFASELLGEAGGPGLRETISAVHGKMVRRHPHVFGERAAGAETDASTDSGSSDSSGQPDAGKGITVDQVNRRWEQQKLEEKGGQGVLDGVPRSLPSLTASYRISQKAASAGFDWREWRQVVDKIGEELDEIQACLDPATVESGDQGRIEEEIGDLLFACSNLSRHLRIDPDRALARANRKFSARFRALEGLVSESGRAIRELDDEELDRLWRDVKEREAIREPDQ